MILAAILVIMVIAGYMLYGYISSIPKRIFSWVRDIFCRMIPILCPAKSYGRGAGKPLHRCPEGTEKDGGLCYVKCRAGYKGVGPVCWAQCPEGYTDYGAGCTKPKSYGRTAGYTSKAQCESHNGTPEKPGGSRGFKSLKGELSTGCEKSGLLWYPKCGKGYHNVGCCVCSPDCPEGTVDTGASCTKKSYGRGVGGTMKCDLETEDLNGLLCYPKCQPRDGKVYKGVGPVCWETSEKVAEE